MNNSNAVFSDRKRQGEWAEVCFAAKAMKHGFTVSRPYGDSCPYDLLVDANGKLSRVQVKSVRLIDGNAYHVSVSRGNHYKHSYLPTEIDFIVAFVIAHDAWYIIPVLEVHPRKTIHVSPHKPSRRRLEKYREAWQLLSPPSDALTKVHKEIKTSL